MNRVLEGMPSSMRPTLQLRAYQLRPDLPTGPSQDGRAFYIEKFGGADTMASLFKRVEAVGRTCDITFDFSDPRLTNTRLAHKAIAAARTLGRQREVADALYAAHFEQRLDIAVDDVVTSIFAEVVGKGRDEVAALLARPDHDDAVDEDLAMGHHLGVTGVPFFILDGRLALSGAQEETTMGQFLQEGVRRAS